MCLLRRPKAGGLRFEVHHAYSLQRAKRQLNPSMPTHSINSMGAERPGVRSNGKERRLAISMPELAGTWTGGDLPHEGGMARHRRRPSRLCLRVLSWRAVLIAGRTGSGRQSLAPTGTSTTGVWPWPGLPRPCRPGQQANHRESAACRSDCGHTRPDPWSRTDSCMRP